MKNFDEIRDNFYRENISLSLVEISSVRAGVEEHGSMAYCANFTEWENGYADSMKFMKRRSDFISGRLAGKMAVRDHFSKINEEEEEKDIQFNEIEIRRLDSGEPAIFIDNSEVDLSISISHSGNYAISGVICESEYKGIGIDIEKIEERDESFQDVAFNDKEIAKLQSGTSPGKRNRELDETITKLWTIKEAVLKSLGIGLNVDIKDIEVVETESDEIEVKISNDVMERFEKLRGKKIKVESFRIDDDYMLSVSRLQ